MASLDELQTQISAGHEALREAIAGAGDVWEQTPADGAEGEESWSPRQAAEHVIGAMTFFAMGIATATGQDAPERSELSLATPDDALPALATAVEVSDRVYGALSDEDMSKEAGRGGTVESLLEIAGGHGSNHAQQIADAS